MARSFPSARKAGSRPSMRDIAILAQVSAMTVSKALRNQPKVAPRTRARILKIAGQVGYRPDPEVTRLMNHLRSRTKPVFQGLICAITDRPAAAEHPYLKAMLEGARTQAEARGYGFTFLHFEEDADHWRRLRRVLWARGAQGVLFLPLREPFDLSGLLPWKEMSVIAATSSILSPDLHRVVPNHYANTLLLCRQLAEKGYRRIGLVIDAVQDARVNHAFSAAVAWHSYHACGEVVPPLIYSTPQPAGLAAWFKREKPDALITSDHLHSREFAGSLGLRLGGTGRLRQHLHRSGLGLFRHRRTAGRDRRDRGGPAGRHDSARRKRHPVARDRHPPSRQLGRRHVVPPAGQDPPAPGSAGLTAPRRSFRLPDRPPPGEVRPFRLGQGSSVGRAED